MYLKAPHIPVSHISLSKLSKILTLLFFVFTSTAVAQSVEECVFWNRDPQSDNFNQIEDPPGTVIGVANLDRNPPRAEDELGRPLTDTRGPTCVFDGRGIYDPNNLGDPVEEDDEEAFRLCQEFPNLPICNVVIGVGENGGGGGNDGGVNGETGGVGGGNNGGGNNGGGNNGVGNNGGGNTGNDPVQTTAIRSSTALQGLGISQGGASALQGAYASVADTVADGGNQGGGASARNPQALTTTNRDSKLYKGVHRAPTVIDPRVEEARVANLIDSITAERTERTSLTETLGYTGGNRQIPQPDSIGVDDEFLKTAVAAYQPIRRLRKDFLEDENAKEDYLNQAGSMQGITSMALGFLDKTLGSSMSLTNEQANQNVTTHLLKQISWTTNKLANPEHAQFYKDTDEKLEACLEYAIGRGEATRDINRNDSTRQRVHFECAEECGTAPDLSGASNTYVGEASGNELDAGNGSYAYCVCCAESADTMNSLADAQNRNTNQTEGPQGANVNELFTLVERAFLGVGQTPQGQEGQALNAAVRMFKRMYGDIVMRPVRGQRGSRNNNFHTTFQQPAWSPHTLTALFKNRCYTGGGDDPAKDLHMSGGDNGQGCHGQEDIEQFGVQYGICPSIAWVLVNWDGILSSGNAAAGVSNSLEDTAVAIALGGAAGGSAGAAGAPIANVSNQEFSKRWVEASLGHELNGRNISEFLSLNGSERGDLEEDDISLLTARVLESFCDSSSVAALVRYHTSFKAQVMDLLILNNSITVQQKSQLSTLIERMTQYIALAGVDTSSRFASEAILTGISMNHDRQRVATLAASQQGLIAASQQAQFGQTIGLLTSGRIEGGTGGAGQTARVINSVRDNFGENAARTVALAERDRSQNDPLNTFLNRLRQR